MSGWHMTGCEIDVEESAGMIYEALRKRRPTSARAPSRSEISTASTAGHGKILRRVVAVAREEGWKSAVLTFDPHPAKLLAPASAPRLLTTLEERARMMFEQGIDEILILPFTPEIAALDPEDFVREILVDKLKARAVLVGANFHFGKRARGRRRDAGGTGRPLQLRDRDRPAGGVAQACDIEQRDSAV